MADIGDESECWLACVPLVVDVHVCEIQGLVVYLHFWSRRSTPSFLKIIRAAVVRDAISISQPHLAGSGDIKKYLLSGFQKEVTAKVLSSLRPYCATSHATDDPLGSDRFGYQKSIFNPGLPFVQENDPLLESGGVGHQHFLNQLLRYLETETSNHFFLNDATNTPSSGTMGPMPDKEVIP